MVIHTSGEKWVDQCTVTEVIYKLHWASWQCELQNIENLKKIVLTTQSISSLTILFCLMSAIPVHILICGDSFVLGNEVIHKMKARPETCDVIKAWSIILQKRASFEKDSKKQHEKKIHLSKWNPAEIVTLTREWKIICKLATKHGESQNNNCKCWLARGYLCRKGSCSITQWTPNAFGGK